ncbi:MAG TPA: CHAD domain-containing protein [Acidobacteriota bacterium]|nr:CHAD domain-containing protein [Acidobacteriota bacterium]
MSAAPADPSATISNQKKLLKLARKRLERFVTLVPKVLVNDDPEAIHDLRVWSRRLQQALRVVLPTPKPPKSKKAIRALRQLRQALGPCRNLDVNIDLIKEKRKHASAGIVQRSWDAVQTELEERREGLIGRARRDLTQHDVFAFIERITSLIENADDGIDPVEILAKAAAKSMNAWEEAFKLAYEQRDEAHLHALRIASKQLRYRAELLADLGQNQAKPLVTALKELQTVLGDWHDRCVLLHYVAEFIGQPNFLASHPDMGRALLAEIEKDKLRNDDTVDHLPQIAAKVRESWVSWKPVTEEIKDTSAR